MSGSNLDYYAQLLNDKYVPATLFLNEDLDILYTHGEVEKYLSFPRALVKFNVAEMVDSKVLQIFRAGLEQCLGGEERIRYTRVVIEKTGKKQLVDLSFWPVQDDQAPEKIVLVEIMPHLRESRPSEEPENAQNQNDFWNEQIKSLEKRLEAAKYRTQSLVDEQELTNEELQASNRQLMSSNEELQSTNEELQSVNEELYTVNSELQIKNEALSTANNDILNLLKSIDIGTIFLDKDLSVRRFTPAVSKHFNLLDIDIGRSISDFSSNLVDVDIKKISQKVYDSLEKYEKEVEDINGNRYLLRVLPYRTQDHLIQGLVITFIPVLNEKDETEG